MPQGCEKFYDIQAAISQGAKPQKKDLEYANEILSQHISTQCDTEARQIIGAAPLAPLEATEEAYGADPTVTPEPLVPTQVPATPTVPAPELSLAQVSPPRIGPTPTPRDIAQLWGIGELTTPPDPASLAQLTGRQQGLPAPPLPPRPARQFDPTYGAGSQGLPGALGVTELPFGASQGRQSGAGAEIPYVPLPPGETGATVGGWNAGDAQGQMYEGLLGAGAPGPLPGGTPGGGTGDIGALWEQMLGGARSAMGIRSPEETKALYESTYGPGSWVEQGGYPVDVAYTDFGLDPDRVEDTVRAYARTMGLTPDQTQRLIEFAVTYPYLQSALGAGDLTQGQEVSGLHEFATQMTQPGNYLDVGAVYDAVVGGQGTPGERAAGYEDLTTDQQISFIITGLNVLQPYLPVDTWNNLTYAMYQVIDDWEDGRRRNDPAYAMDLPEYLNSIGVQNWL